MYVYTHTSVYIYIYICIHTYVSIIHVLRQTLCRPKAVADEVLSRMKSKTATFKPEERIITIVTMIVHINLTSTTLIINKPNNIDNKTMIIHINLITNDNTHKPNDIDNNTTYTDNHDNKTSHENYDNNA